jgi:hypothetical protein
MSVMPPGAERWQLLFQSVRGTAHERDGLPCQDFCLARLRPPRQAPVLLLACADGAGSAHHAERGARLACTATVSCITADLAEGLAVPAIDRDTALSWLLRLRRILESEAGACDCGLKDLACTLLIAVVGPDAAAFVQLGDGAIVLGEQDVYTPVFWPQIGEYANTTHFVTDPDAVDFLAFELRRQRVDELALLTDGLQGLALRFADRTAHSPFFRPMFARLRASSGTERLSSGLRHFLASPAVNARTDDDKTLLLATRVPARAAPDLV